MSACPTFKRNAARYADQDHDQFDRFAPGWREKVSTDMKQKPHFVRQFLKYWSDKVTALGLPQAKHWELNPRRSWPAAVVLVDPTCET